MKAYRIILLAFFAGVLAASAQLPARRSMGKKDKTENTAPARDPMSSPVTARTRVTDDGEATPPAEQVSRSGMPTRNARHGHIFTWDGIRNLNNAKYQLDDKPLDEHCNCPVCRTYSRAYVRHLLKSGEMLGQRLTVMHNLWFYNNLMAEIRKALDEGRFAAFRAQWSDRLSQRI